MLVKLILPIMCLICLMVTSPALALDCSLAKEKLSYNNFSSHSQLIVDRKLDEGLVKIYDALNYLKCVETYSDRTLYGIQYGVNNLGHIYNLQKVDEHESYKLYSDKIGKNIKNSSADMFLFYNFLWWYTGSSYYETGWKFKRDGNICTFTTTWGSVYYGCDQCDRVSNSPLTSVLKMNELSLVKALTNIAYVNNIYDIHTCYKKEYLTDSLYGIFPMIAAEKRIMMMSETAPFMSTQLLQKALKLDASFYDLADTCKKIANQSHQ